MVIDPDEIVSLAAARLAAENADQIESEAIRLGETGIESGLTDDGISQDRMADLYDTASAGSDTPLWDEQDEARETGDREVLAEFRRRVDRLGPLYPFELSATQTKLTFVPDRSKTSVYEYCLAFSSTRQDIRYSPTNTALPEFERLVGRCLQAFCGPGTEFFRLGWPPEQAHGRTGKFSEAIKTLHSRTCGEWEFRNPFGQPDAPDDSGDFGIDVVIWKPFGELDQRVGVPMVIGQCACGKDALDPKKWKDLQPDDVQRQLGGTLAFAGVLKCLAIPHHLPDPRIWRKVVASGGIVLDRIRLTWMAETYLDGDMERARLQPHIDNLNAPPMRERKKPATPPAKPAAKTRRP